MRLKNRAFAGNTGQFDNEFDLSGSGAVYSSKSSSTNSLVELSMPDREIWNPQRHSGHSTTGGSSIVRREELLTSKLGSTDHAGWFVEFSVMFFTSSARCNHSPAGEIPWVEKGYSTVGNQGEYRRGLIGRASGHNNLYSGFDPNLFKHALEETLHAGDCAGASKHLTLGLRREPFTILKTRVRSTRWCMCTLNSCYLNHQCEFTGYSDVVNLSRYS